MTLEMKNCLDFIFYFLFVTSRRKRMLDVVYLMFLLFSRCMTARLDESQAQRQLLERRIRELSDELQESKDDLEAERGLRLTSLKLILLRALHGDTLFHFWNCSVTCNV